MSMKSVMSAMLAILLPAVVQAHYLWIESEDVARARVYFGEFNEDLREKAGGRLDERDSLQVWIQSEEGKRKRVKVVKADDHFAAELNSRTGWLLVEDLASEVKDWTASNIGIVKPMYYARAAIANRTAVASTSDMLHLDILPENGTDGQTYRVFFGGKPLAKATLMVYAPNLWAQELKTDQDGKLTISTPWPGRYVLEVIHLEKVPGTYQEISYEAVRHRVTYSFVCP